MIYDLDYDPDEPLTLDTARVRLRSVRNAMLAASDWTVLPGAPTNRRAWKRYRKALRDLPETWDGDPQVKFPEPPL